MDRLTRKVTGTLSGRASGGSIQARVTATGISAGLTVHTAGDTQSVTISRKEMTCAELL